MFAVLGCLLTVTAQATSMKMTADACRREFPDLLSRIDREFAPWETHGISRHMVDKLWRCDPKDFPDTRRAIGLFVMFRGGKLAAEEGRYGPTTRNMHVVRMLQSVAEEFDVPDCDFVMTTCDHPSQGYRRPNSRPYNASFDPSLAPLFLAYRKPHDTGSIAVPDWTFLDSLRPPPSAHSIAGRAAPESPREMRQHAAEQDMVTKSNKAILLMDLRRQGLAEVEAERVAAERVAAETHLKHLTVQMSSSQRKNEMRMNDERHPETPSISDAADVIMKASRDYQWSKRIPKLFFMGDNSHHDERARTWFLARDTPDDWIRIGLLHVQAIAGRVAPRESLEFNRTSLPDHCQYKYLLNLAGNAASSRFKYLFFCNSTVISPVRSGGNDGAGPGNEYEEFWYHRLMPGENVLMPPDVTFLPGLIHELQADEPKARRIAAAGASWAKKELTKAGAWCYWAAVLQKLAELQRKGGVFGVADSADILRGSLKTGGPQPSRIKSCCVCDKDNGR